MLREANEDRNGSRFGGWTTLERGRCNGRACSRHDAGGDDGGGGSWSLTSHRPFDNDRSRWRKRDRRRAGMDAFRRDPQNAWRPTSPGNRGHKEARGGMQGIGRRRTYLSSAVFARWTRFFVQSPLARTGWEGDEEEGAEDGAAAPVAIARGSVGFAGRADEGFWGVSRTGPPVTVPPSFLPPSSLARLLPICHLWLLQ